MLRVPLVVAGRNVAAVGQRCSALVESVDLFPTIVELMGEVTPPDIKRKAAALAA